MPFYLKIADIKIIDNDTIVSDSTEFNEYFKNNQLEVFDEIKNKITSLSIDDIFINEDGKVIIKNKEFLEAISSPPPTLLAGEWVKNVGCGSGCVI